MEGKKKADGSSSSSFTSELFGSRDSSVFSSSSTGIFGSIFAPSSKVIGRGSLRSDVADRKQESGNQIRNTKSGAPDPVLQSNEGCGGIQRILGKDMMMNSSFFLEEKVQPCHLSSSIYYGGQDVYCHPQTTQSSTAYTTFTEDGGEDDSGSAARGNWWQGSLYY